MEKLMIKNVLNKLEFVRVAFVASVGPAVAGLIFASNAFAQEAPAPPGAPPGAAPAAAEVERVIVTGSNIPTAEETGPNPVDTYRPQDIEKLGVRNAVDLLNRLPAEAGSTMNTNIANGGDGSVQVNLRGLLPKETLTLIDGKRVAPVGVAPGASGGVDINLIPFPMIDHIDILKDGASAVYGADAVAGVFNIFLVHKFRGLEIGGSIGNTNLGSSNDAREMEGWIKAGVGDDKTDIVVIADFYDKAAIFSRDRDITRNAFAKPFGGFDNRSPSYPGKVQEIVGGTTTSFVLKPQLFFSANSPPPHSAANAATSPFYTRLSNLPYPDGDIQGYNFAALTPSIPAGDRQSIYGSFTRDLCDKYLVVFADFLYSRSFFDAALAAAPFTPDPFKDAAGIAFSPSGISVPIQNAFNPFTVADATLPPGTPFAGVPVTTGVRYRSIIDTQVRGNKFTINDMVFDAGLRGEMGEFGDYFKTWNWEAGFRYSVTQQENIESGGVSKSGLREALLDTDPATAFNPFSGINGGNTQAAKNRVYATLHNSGTFELPLGYLTINGDLFNLPAGPVSFALGGEYHGERWTNIPDSLNTTFNSIGFTDLVGSRVNRDVWAIYQELRVPITSPTWNFPGAYSFEIDFAEREEWYSQNTTNQLDGTKFSTRYNAQKPKISVRWQPLDPKYIGALTLRGTYTEAFHAPTLSELTPAGGESFELIHDPKGLTTENQVEAIVGGNPLLIPETAYEYSAGVVYSPKWVKGLTVSADFWHIDLRNVATSLGAQFILDHESQFPALVIRNPQGEITRVFDSVVNVAGVITEGLDYEAIYILDSTIFGGPDFGRFTFTLNGTYLSRFVFQGTPDSKSFEIAGQFIATSATFTGSLPHNRAYVSLFWDGPAETWLGGFDVGATVHYNGQYNDDNIDLGPVLARKVREWTTLDLIASYAFNLPPPAPAEVPGFAKDGGKNVKMDGKEKNVLPVSTAEYNPCGWRAWLNGTTITVGMQNVFDEDPPFVAGAFENNYDESLADVRGRFWYVQLKKRF
jgi:iron complex outermembrane receptor protein